MFCHLPGSFLVYGQVSRKGEVTKTPMIWKGGSGASLLRSMSMKSFCYISVTVYTIRKLCDQNMSEV